MSLEQEVSEVLGIVAPRTSPAAVETVNLALAEVSRLMSVTGDTFLGVCLEVEAATSREAVKKAFRRFNGITRMFLEAAPAPEHDGLIREALGSLQLSKKFAQFIGSGVTVREAVKVYKTSILRDLAIAIRRRNEQMRQDDELDRQLFSQLLPEPTSPLSGSEGSPEAKVHLVGPVSKKRSIQAVTDLSSIPKKGRIPDLATLAQVIEDNRDEVFSKKKILVTRERLRASMNDHKGLLDLVGPSTNALERTKRMELLKSAGINLTTKGVKSFADKLGSAKVRLDIGLGGNSVADTLLFGTDVLSCPGSLSPKNIREVKNNIVEGSSTWKHQNAYARMMIAGCLHQAMRIIEQFDEVLFGPAPESLVKESHKDIRELLDSAECREFLDGNNESESAAAGTNDNFVKKVIEAVSPIIPITLRNKALDGSYLRSALHLMGASEFLFAQYEEDVRVNANPAGLVGMSSYIHAELRRATIYGEELKPFREFMRDMRTQYQTSLGLGSSFPRDSGSRFKKRSAGGRGQAYFSAGRGTRRLGMSRRQMLQQTPFSGAPTLGFQQGFGGRGNGFVPRDEPGICYDYRAGICRRGGTCRFRHPNM